MNKKSGAPPRSGKTFLKRLTDLFINVSSPLVIAASLIILIFIFFLSFILPQNEKKALIQRTDDFCISTAIGLSSVTIEAVTGNKRPIVGDYLNNLASQHIQGLKFAEVIEFNRENSKKESKDIIGGTVIGSLDFHQIGKKRSIEQIQAYLDLEGIEKRYLTNRSDVFYEYSYPVTWKVKYKGNDLLISLGAIQLRFAENEILKSYHRFQMISGRICAGAFVSGIMIVIFYLLLLSLLKGKIKEIHELSITDTLTQIYNRKKFNEAMESEIHRMKRYGGSLSLMMFDIDHFKKINDTFGHDAGDAVLIQVASIVKKAVRNTDLFARWGGEEFMVLTPGTGNKETADFADRIRQDLERFQFEGAGKVTCSFGVSSYREFDTPDSFIKRADNALYRAKESGRNRVVAG